MRGYWEDKEMSASRISLLLVSMPDCCTRSIEQVLKVGLFFLSQVIFSRWVHFGAYERKMSLHLIDISRNSKHSTTTTG